jgi:hypothetical protein
LIVFPSRFGTNKNACIFAATIHVPAAAARVQPQLRCCMPHLVNPAVLAGRPAGHGEHSIYICTENQKSHNDSACIIERSYLKKEKEIQEGK